MTDTSTLQRSIREERDAKRIASAHAGELVWMDAEEAAAYINYPKATFDSLAGREEIPSHKRGAGYRYFRSELDEWLLEG